jgi:hypothetical protein
LRGVGFVHSGDSWHGSAFKASARPTFGHDLGANEGSVPATYGESRSIETLHRSRKRDATWSASAVLSLGKVLSSSLTPGALLYLRRAQPLQKPSALVDTRVGCAAGRKTQPSRPRSSITARAGILGVGFCESQDLLRDLELPVRSFQSAEKSRKVDGIKSSSGHHFVERLWCCDGSRYRIVVPLGHPLRSHLEIPLAVRSADEVLTTKRSERRAQLGPFRIRCCALGRVLLLDLVILGHGGANIIGYRGANIVVSPAWDINR